MSKLKLFLLLLLFFFISATLICQKTIRLSNGEWPPYTSKNLKHYGVFSHIVTEAFAIEGIKVIYDFYPWSRSYILAKHGDFEGSLTWAPTEERIKDFYFTDPVTYNKKVFFHLKTFPFEWESIDDLKKLYIGATAKYTYGDDFDTAAKNNSINVQYVPRDIQNIHKLISGRIDIFPMEIEVGYSLIHTEFPPETAALITNHPKPVMQTPICVVISRKIDANYAQELIKLFNRGLKKLKNSGKYEQYIMNSRKGKYKK